MAPNLIRLKKILLPAQQQQQPPLTLVQQRREEAGKGETARVEAAKKTRDREENDENEKARGGPMDILGRIWAAIKRFAQSEDRLGKIWAGITRFVRSAEYETHRWLVGCLASPMTIMVACVALGPAGQQGDLAELQKKDLKAGVFAAAQLQKRKRSRRERAGGRGWGCTNSLRAQNPRAGLFAPALASL